MGLIFILLVICLDRITFLSLFIDKCFQLKISERKKFSSSSLPFHPNTLKYELTDYIHGLVVKLSFYYGRIYT